MKKEFFDYMHEIMDDNKDVYFLMAGLGWPRVDEFLEKYPTRAFNTEASEQATLDIAVGLAYAGKTPVVYTITPFLYRGFETIRTYIAHENLHVILVGVGRNDDYSKHDGYSHDAKDDMAIMNAAGVEETFFPNTPKQLHSFLNHNVGGDSPIYINIPR